MRRRRRFRITAVAFLALAAAAESHRRSAKAPTIPSRGKSSKSASGTTGS